MEIRGKLSRQREQGEQLCKGNREHDALFQRGTVIGVKDVKRNRQTADREGSMPRPHGAQLAALTKSTVRHHQRGLSCVKKGNVIRFSIQTIYFL